MSLNFNFFENKMHNISRKNLIAGAVIIFIGIGIFFSWKFYQTHKKNQRDLIQEKLTYESAVTALAKEKKDLNTLAGGLGINYFSRFPEASHMDLSFFMFNRISTIANKWKVNLVSFSPAEKEIKGNYSLISFSGAISASFSDMVNFFQELEDKEKISIDNLKINTSSRASSLHQAEFDLVCLEFNDPLLKGREEKESDTSPSDKEKIKIVKRDPFLNPFEKMQVARPAEKNKAGTVDVASEFSLTGINCSATLTGRNNKPHDGQGRGRDWRQAGSRNKRRPSNFKSQWAALYPPAQRNPETSNKRRKAFKNRGGCAVSLKFKREGNTMFKKLTPTWWLPLLVMSLVILLSPLSLKPTFSDDQTPVLQLPQERCSMRFVDAEVKDVLRLLAKEYKLNLIISENVGGVITVDFDQVLLEDIFFSVLKTADLGYTLKGNVILVATQKELLDQETSRVKEMEKQAEGRKKILEAQAMVSETIKVTIHPQYQI